MLASSFSCAKNTIVCGVFINGREAIVCRDLFKGRAVISSGNHAYVVSCLRYRARFFFIWQLAVVTTRRDFVVLVRDQMSGQRS